MSGSIIDMNMARAQKAACGTAPFELEGKLTEKDFEDCGKIYYIAGSSFPERIVTILEADTPLEP